MFAINASIMDQKLRPEAIGNSIHPSLSAKSALSTTLHLDQACQSAAQRADLPGMYVALVSTPSLPLELLLESKHKPGLPIINTKVRMVTYLLCLHAYPLDYYCCAYTFFKLIEKTLV